MADAELFKRTVAAWIMCERDNGHVSIASQSAMTMAEHKVKHRGYLLDDSRERRVTTADQYADFFITNKVAVMAEIPVLLTEQQLVVLEIETAEHELEKYLYELAEFKTPFWWLSHDGRLSVRWAKADVQATRTLIANKKQHMIKLDEAA